MPVAFKLQHGIHYMFKYFRPGYAPFLVDVSDKDYGRTSTQIVFSTPVGPRGIRMTGAEEDGVL